ncbi:MAG: tRNA uridine-5-carboxymethylaminomethyl(34) synthesis enzyme MnmG, partial [Candidatus Gastranaerophilaceae bacterium]
EPFENFKSKYSSIENEIERLKSLKITASEQTNEILKPCGEFLNESVKAAELLKRPNVSYEMLKKIDPETADLNYSSEIFEQVETKIKYDGYIKRQIMQVEAASKTEKVKIPDDIDYTRINHISTETREKLNKIRPKTLGQASRIGGVKPADIAILSVMIEGKRYKRDLITD